MIRGLRRVHLLSWSLIALLLPAAIISILAARSVPVLPQASAPEHLERANLGDFSATFDRQQLSISSIAPASAPDLLIYWTDGPIDSSQTADWTLVGPAHDGKYQMPHGFDSNGTLVLYSLAHAEIVDTLELGTGSIAGNGGSAQP